MNGVGYGITPFMGTHGILARSSGGGGGAFVNEYSMSLDGIDEYFNVADADNLSFGDGVTDSPFSISAWIKFDATGTTFNILDKSDAYPNGEYKFLKLSDDRILIRLISNNNELNRIGRTTNSIASYVGQWIHVVATYNGNSANNGLKIYINSVQSDVADNSKNTYVAMSNTTYPVKIGNLFDGLIDEVAIFNTELSASDVTAIYNGGAPTDLTSLSPLSWYRMGDGDTWGGSSWTLTDNGSGGNDATSVNMEEADRLPISPNSYTQNSFNFNSNSYFTLATKTQNFTDFSLSFWILSRGGTNKTIFANDSLTVANGGGILANIQDSAYRVRYYDDSTGYTNLSDTLIGFVWNHIVITYQSSTNELKGYTNNVLFTTLNPTITTFANNSHSFDKIGYSVGSNYTGSNLDEISVFDSVLSPAQISQIFGIGTPNDISSLAPVHHWRMGENATWNGSNWTITDIGSSPITLTSNGMTEAYKTGDQPYVI